MLPKVAIVRVAESEKMPLPRYMDGVGTSMLLCSASSTAIKIAPQHFEVVGTGMALALPLGMEAQVRSLKESTSTGVLVINAPITIDASDRKEIKVCLYNISQESVIINFGDPIALLVFSPAIRIEWMDMTQRISYQVQEKQNQTQKEETPILIQTDIVFETKEETNSQQNSLISPTNTETTLTLEEFEPLEEEPVQSEKTDILSEIEEPLKETTNYRQGVSETLTETIAKQPDIMEEQTPVAEQPIVEPPAILAEFEKMENNFVSSSALTPENSDTPSDAD